MKALSKVFILIALAVLVPVMVQAAPVTVKFMSSDADLPAAFVDKFNQTNPDKITIVRTEPDYAKFMAEAASGNASDLINVGEGSDLAYYVPRGLFRDITPLINKSKVLKPADIDPLGNVNYRYDGKEFGKGPWYGMTKDYNNIGAITYNKEMFKAAGIPPLSETVPITYDDLYNLAKKLTKKSGGKVSTWGYDLGGGWWKFLASDMAYMQGLSFFKDADKSIMNDDPKMSAIWKYFARFFVEDIVPNVKNPAPSWAGANFQSDRVAIVQLGYWYGAQLRTNKDFDKKYGWAPTPVMVKGGMRVTNTLGATGVCMYAKTKVADQAFKVFEWYMGGDYGVERAKTGWGIPPLKSLEPLLPEANVFDKSRKYIALDDAKYFKPWQANEWATGPSWDPIWTSNIEPLVRGQKTMDQFISGWYTGLNKLFADGKAEVGK
jgi:multiple sugar transport system substrate-binding protein